MLDHLDDPEPHATPPGVRDRVVAAGARRRRRRRIGAGAVGAAAALALAAVAASALVDRRLDDVQRVDVAGIADRDLALGDPRTVVLVATDARADDENRPLPGRADAVMVLRVDPGADTITVLPLPRDLAVEGPDGEPTRLSAVASGPVGFVSAVSSTIGMPIDTYIELDMDGAVAIGDALGGLDLAFAHPVRDRSVGLAQDGGCRSFDGAMLLALARSRHIEAYVDGGWLPDRTGDHGRIERLQAIGSAVLERLARLDASDPTELWRTFDAVVSHLKVDSATTTDELKGLVRAVVGAEVRQLRLPVVEVALPNGSTALASAAEGEPVAAAVVGGAGLEPGLGSVAGMSSRDSRWFEPTAC